MGVNQNEFRTERLPSDIDVAFAWSIRRTPTDAALKFVCISADIFGVRTHYYNRRTGPCRRDQCPACESGNLSRWTGYLQAVDVRDQSRILFEFTPAIAGTLDEHFKKHGTLRGAQCMATRTAPRINAKIHLAIKGVAQGLIDLPSELPMWPILSHIWGLRVEVKPITSTTEGDAMTEEERTHRTIAPVTMAEGDRWMSERAGDLAGQLLMPLDKSEGSRNGRQY